jgi:hypothetical protein
MEVINLMMRTSVRNYTELLNSKIFALQKVFIDFYLVYVWAGRCKKDSRVSKLSEDWSPEKENDFHVHLKLRLWERKRLERECGKRTCVCMCVCVCVCVCAAATAYFM